MFKLKDPNNQISTTQLTKQRNQPKQHKRPKLQDDRMKRTFLFSRHLSSSEFFTELQSVVQRHVQIMYASQRDDDYDHGFLSKICYGEDGRGGLVQL